MRETRRPFYGARKSKCTACDIQFHCSVKLCLGVAILVRRSSRGGPRLNAMPLRVRSDEAEKTHMKKILLSAIAFVTLTGSAVAADMAVKAAPPPPSYRIYNWTGFYIGANGGWGSSHNCWDFGNFVTPVGLVVAGDGCRDRSGGWSVGKLGIAGKAISLCSDWKHRAIGPTSATRASACLTRRSQPA